MTKEELKTAVLAKYLESNAPPPADDEPFACPACGQLLGPMSRVCAACRQPVDPAKINRPEAARPTEGPPTVAAVLPASFSWHIFFVVLLAWLALMGVCASLAELAKARTIPFVASAQFIPFGVVLGSSIWVLQDAHAKAIPKPFRWAIGSILVWIIFFPWYLSRRRSPAAPCRWVEAELKPIGKFLAFALIVLLVLWLLAALTKGPASH